MLRIACYCFSASLVLLAPRAHAQGDTTVVLAAPADMVRHFAPFDRATFVLLEPASDRRIRVRPEQARERVSPASTFKIPHVLFALDAGVVGEGEVLRYDAARDPAQGWWPEAWAQDQTLPAAVEVSAVWAFQELARRLGPERELFYLDAIGYGNRDISSGLTTFWLGESLLISADEQVEFLHRLWEGALPVSAKAQALTRDLVPLLREERDYRLRGKTGTAPAEGGMLNWLIGVAEEGDRRAFYALWLEAPRWVDPPTRIALVEAFLADLGWSP